MQLGTYLEGHQISKPDFAETIKVTVQAVHRYVSGERTPNLVVMQRIINATNGSVGPSDFFEAATAAQTARESTAA
jgi:transcriptional regulator with XRE-family HTH domain